MVSAINAFSAVFNVTLTLLAQTYTTMDQNYTQVKGSILSNFSQAGLVLGIVMSFVFAANTTVSCLDTSRAFMRFCKESKDVKKIDKLPFPQSHIKPLKILTAYGTITSMRMVFSPMINTLAAPMMAGMFLGVKGLLFMISGSNVLILCLSLFLINSGQSWASARKFVLFGLLKDKEGNVIGPDSPHYENLGIGESIGGPFEATTGPALNNFIKFVAVFAFVTGGPGAMYDETPEKTWPFGIVVVVASVSLVSFSKVGLTLLLRLLAQMAKRRRRKQAFEEGDVLDDDDDEVEGYG
jgi:Na+/H+-translocating membrane pyrophosphatase